MAEYSDELRLAYVLYIAEGPRTGRQITAEAGVDHMALTSWRTSGGAQLATLSAVLGALGYKLAIVPLTRQNKSVDS